MNRLSDYLKFPGKKVEKSVHSDNNSGSGPWWKKAIQHYLVRLALGIAAGAVLGLLYWKFVGCHSGSCPLTSSPAKTVIMFSLMGGLFAYNRPSSGEEAK